MATLAADNLRVFETGHDAHWDDVPMEASEIIYGGAAVGDNGSGYAQPLEAGDPFWGFADAKEDNSSGAAGAKDVRVRQKGVAKLTVVGASAVTNKDATVYASDDDTFTLTATGNSAIGKVVRWITGTTCMVAFEAVAVRSI